MEIKLLELLFTQPAIYAVLGILVWALTYVVKRPIKAQTALIKDERKRKIANKWILLIPFILAMIVSVVYFRIISGNWLEDVEMILAKALTIAVISITWYNVFEGIRGKKSEYEHTDEGRALFDLLLVYSKDPVKVRLLMDQCKNNLENGAYSIKDTVKGFLPPGTEEFVFETIVKTIERYFIRKKEEVL